MTLLLFFLLLLILGLLHSLLLLLALFGLGLINGSGLHKGDELAVL